VNTIDLRWIKYAGNPVISNGPEGSWDGHFVRDPWIVYEAGEYRMWYWGNFAIGYATSKDEISWHKYKRNPVFFEDPEAKRPCVIHKGDTYYLYYQRSNDRGGGIGLTTANSPTGPFSKPREVLRADCPWEESVLGCICVLYDEEDSVWKMWYSAGRVEIGTWREPKLMGYATSKDGIHWQKHKNNPVISPLPNIWWLSKAVSSLNVVKQDKCYYGFFNALSTDGRSRVGYCESKDCIIWDLKSSDLILDLGSSNDFDASHCFRPFPMYDEKENIWKIWYNGKRGEELLSQETIGYAYSEQVKSKVR